VLSFEAVEATGLSSAGFVPVGYRNVAAGHLNRGAFFVIVPCFNHHVGQQIVRGKYLRHKLKVSASVCPQRAEICD